MRAKKTHFPLRSCCSALLFNDDAVGSTNSEAEDEYKTEHENRVTEFKMNDPVHRVDILWYFQTQVSCRTWFSYFLEQHVPGSHVINSVFVVGVIAETNRRKQFPAINGHSYRRHD